VMDMRRITGCVLCLFLVSLSLLILHITNLLLLFLDSIQDSDTVHLNIFAAAAADDDDNNVSIVSLVWRRMNIVRSSALVSTVPLIPLMILPPAILVGSIHWVAMQLYIYN
jgi:hypothetical protein